MTEYGSCQICPSDAEKSLKKIDYITFSVPYTNVDMSKMLKGIGKHIGVPGECVFVQDYKESFCQYMFYQPKRTVAV